MNYWLNQYQIPRVATARNYELVEARQDIAENNRSVVISGGIKTDPLVLRLNSGDASALRDVVLRSRPQASSLTWNPPLDDWNVSGDDEFIASVSGTGLAGFEEFQPVDKPFLVTLEILRHTSSAPVTSAVPMFGMHTRTNKYVHLAMQSLRLYEAVRPETVEMMGHLRLLLTGTDHPFLGGFSRLDQVADRWKYVELRGPQYYADFRLTDIQHQVGTS